MWVSITGAGRDGAAADRVSFGDDAAVAGGLVAGDDHGPMSLRDAMADPVAGLLAAAGALAALSAPGAWLLDVALAPGGELRRRAAASRCRRSALPQHRGPATPAGQAPAPGAHTGEVLADWGVAAR